MRSVRQPGMAAAVLVVAALCLSACQSSVLKNAGNDLVPTPSPVPPTTAPLSFDSSLHVAMPPDLMPPATSACARQARPAGWLARENALPGVAGGFRLPPNQPDGVVGYLDRWSAVCGDTLGLHLSGPPGRVRVVAYRLGWYHGARARAVWTSPLVDVPQRLIPHSEGRARMVEADWPTTVQVTVTADWTPGMYLLCPQSATGKPEAGIPVVVRDDAGHEPLLVKESVLTWEAYNEYGGSSLYHGPYESLGHAIAVQLRSRVASMARPLEGSGYGGMLSSDLPLVSFVESLGIDTAYTTDVDVDQRPSQLLQHTALVSGGHSEYWTTRMYDAVEAARNRGVNIAFLGANNVYWHARLEPGPLGPDSRMAVYRVYGEDPLAQSDPADVTVQWRAQPLNRNELALLGQTYSVVGVHGDFLVLTAPRWLFAGTGAGAGAAFESLAGGEADAYQKGGALPPGDQVLAESVYAGTVHRRPTLKTGTMTYYSAPSGAGVFAAGTTVWVCALDGSCRTDVIAPPVQAFARALTANLLRAFSQPLAGRTNPSVATPPVPADVFARDHPNLVGTWGGAEKNG